MEPSAGILIPLCWLESISSDGYKWCREYSHLRRNWDKFVFLYCSGGGREPPPCTTWSQKKLCRDGEQCINSKPHKVSTTYHSIRYAYRCATAVHCSIHKDCFTPTLCKGGVPATCEGTSKRGPHASSFSYETLDVCSRWTTASIKKHRLHNGTAMSSCSSPSLRTHYGSGSAELW